MANSLAYETLTDAVIALAERKDPATANRVQELRLQLEILARAVREHHAAHAEPGAGMRHLTRRANADRALVAAMQPFGGLVTGGSHG